MKHRKNKFGGMGGSKLGGIIAGPLKRVLVRFVPRLCDIITCPITHEIMTDPVIASDNITYEREAITTWIQDQRQQFPHRLPLSPQTSKPLLNLHLNNNILIKQLIDEIGTECRTITRLLETGRISPTKFERARAIAADLHRRGPAAISRFINRADTVELGLVIVMLLVIYTGIQLYGSIWAAATVAGGVATAEIRNARERKRISARLQEMQRRREYLAPLGRQADADWAAEQDQWRRRQWRDRIGRHAAAGLFGDEFDPMNVG